jgi:hypothetical protein
MTALSKLPHVFPNLTVAWRKFQDDFRTARLFDEAPKCI